MLMAVAVVGGLDDVSASADETRRREYACVTTTKHAARRPDVWDCIIVVSFDMIKVLYSRMGQIAKYSTSDLLSLASLSSFQRQRVDEDP